MAKGEDARSEMALARQSDGINVIFDQNSPPSSWSRTRTSSDSSCPSSSGSYRGRGSNRGRYRSSSSTSSSSSSRSSSRARSRSHPRCHRRSSRCRCDNHRRYGRGRYRRSPPRHYKAHSRSPSPDRYSRRRRYRSRSRSSSGLRRYRGAGSRLRCQISQSSPRSYRSHSRSRSSGRSVSSSLGDKRELLKDAAANAVKILGLETLELPESVKPILSEQCGESPVSETWVRQDPEKTPSQSSDVEPDEFSPKMSPKRKTISFSINNSVAKPTVAAPSCAKVTPRVDSYESRKPYGHWVPVRSRQTSNARKHTLKMSH
ncbi:arginine/serine-rich protein 1 isoform X1 [Thunnus albacares]|uniref:arginine/serine-rich protein 1 isoform X1 n=1 Tax=Thunnus albacares TaxID=8236 RepID=UPI001CF66EF2|nr:arginine/serine-rich protein 1 isoform X1 [Thunnus albacares]